jgi:hypothetical protein
MHILDLGPELIIEICRSIPTFSFPKPDMNEMLANFSQIMTRGLREAKLGGRIDVSRLSRTCKALHKIVEPELYRRITLVSARGGSENTGDPRAARVRLNGSVISALLATILGRLQLAELIHVLDFDETGARASELTSLCTHVREITTTRSQILRALPNPQLVIRVSFLDDAHDKQGPLVSVDWARFTGLQEFKLILRPADVENREDVDRAKDVFSALSLRNITLKATYDIFDATEPFDVLDLLLFAGPKTEVLDIEDMELVPESMFPPGYDFVDVALREGGASADMSALGSVHILRITDSVQDGDSQDCLQLPHMAKLPPNLEALHLHSSSKPFQLDDEALCSLRELFADAQSNKRSVKTLFYTDKYEEEDEDALEELKRTCNDHSISVKAFDDEQVIRGNREWIRILCKFICCDSSFFALTTCML